MALKSKKRRKTNNPKKKKLALKDRKRVKSLLVRKEERTPRKLIYNKMKKKFKDLPLNLVK